MKKTTNILLFIFVGLTIFLVIVHLESVEYFIDSKTNESSIQIPTKSYNISYSMHEDLENNLHVDLSFNNIKTSFQILDLKILVNQLNVIEIEPYWGMKPWGNEKFKQFWDIPDSLKNLSIGSNPYFAYVHLFKDPTKAKNYNVEIEALIQENDKNYRINKNLEFDRINKIEVRPWDMHNDFSFLLIYLFGFISFILIIIKLTSILIRRKNTRG